MLQAIVAFLVIHATALAQDAPAPAGSTRSLAPVVKGVALGFAGVYRLGSWTELRVAINPGANPAELAELRAIAADPDGVPVTYSAPLDAANRAAGEVRLPIRIGQDGGSLTVELVDKDGRVATTRTFVAGRQGAATQFPVGLPTAARLIVSLGSKADLVEPLARGDQTDPEDRLHTVHLKSVADLPATWNSYESIDAVVLSGADAQAFAASPGALRDGISALARWVQLGGQLVIFCGGESSALLADDGALAPLVPGRFEGDLAPLQDFTPLEIFSGASDTVTRTFGNRLRVPRLVDVTGRRVAEGPAELPLVVRTRRGLGEVTFVGVDPEAPPLDAWSGVGDLIRRALQWPAPLVDGAARTRSNNPVAADLTNQLRRALDQQFVGVSATPFAWVAGLVLVYVALIGPIDYFLLQRLGRPQWTWLTFPLVVAAAGATAYALAYRVKGRELRVNQLEIVDVDVAANHARGTLVTHMFNPRVTRYDLTLEPRFANEAVDRRPETVGAESEHGGVAPPPLQSPASSLQPVSLPSWLGVPGFGLGAMQGQHGQLASFDAGYQIDIARDRIAGMPVEQWSTKSLIARWTGDVGVTIDAALHPQGDDQLSGRLTNRTGLRLDDCVLAHGNWAYKLASLDDGEEVVITDELPNATLKTTLTSVAAGDDPNARRAADGSVPFDALSTDVARIAKLMMFYDAIGGAAYAATPHRHMAYLDLSRLLRGDQAILIARAPATAGSQWNEAASTQLGDQRAARQLTSADDNDRQWIYYRFVLPLTPEEEGDARPMIGPTQPGPQGN